MANPYLRRGCLLILSSIVFAVAGTSRAQAPSEVDELRKQMQELLRHNQEQQKQIEALQKRLDAMERPAEPAPEQVKAPPAEAPAAALDKALEDAGVTAEPRRPAAATGVTPLFARRFGAAELKLIDISFDILTAAGWSTEGGDSLRELQGGAHDPNRRGFTLQQGEFSLTGAVDPYFTAEAHIVFTPDGVELEEAFFTTSSLPYGFQLEGGHFFTEFGRINPLHPHAWRWIDQPVINSRLFGGDGLRAPGFRLGWLTPLPWYSELDFGMQNADEGETTLSFLNGEGVGGRPAVSTDVESLSDLLYLARWANAWSITDELSTLIGISGLYGSNSTGNDGRTFIYGADATFKWRPAANFRGWPFLEWQTEVMKRDYTADWFLAGTELGGGDADGGHAHGEAEEEPGAEDEFPENLPGDILRDWGLYTQLLYGFHYGWAAGFRFDYASGHQPSVADGVLVSRMVDPFRDDRYRFSPLLIYHPSEFSRVRLQYNYDVAKHLEDDDAHSVWLGAEVLYGMHPAHKY